MRDNSVIEFGAGGIRDDSHFAENKKPDSKQEITYSSAGIPVMGQALRIKDRSERMGTFHLLVSRGW